MLRLPKLFLFVILVIFLFQSFPIKPVFSQNPQDVYYPGSQNLEQSKVELREQAKDEGKTFITGQDANNFQLSSTVYNTTNLIACTNPDPNVCNPNQTALGVLSQMMTTLYAHPPASSIAYVHHVLTNAGLAKSVYAQGIGFYGLAPLLPFWQTFRNISYSILIIVMVAIGFMIIFRMKIDPKTVIGVQAALPKIVMTLILITFSYPIVGFLVDLMYLVMALAIALMVSGIKGAPAFSDIAKIQSTFLTGDLLDLLQAVFGGYWGALGAGAGGIAGGLAIFAFLTSWTPVGWIVLGFGLIMGLILGLGLLYTFLRLFMILLNSYIQILIGLILGPLILLNEAIPGRSAFKNWLLDIISNLSVYPATAMILLFASYLSSQRQGASQLLNLPFVGIAFEDMFSKLLALGVVFMAPQLVARIKKAFHPQPTLPVTAGTAFSPLTGALGTGMGAMSSFYYMQQFGQHGVGRAILDRLPGRKRPPGQ